MVFFSSTVSAQNADTIKSEIYSKLKCCDCGMKFEKCRCAHAGPMKAYIDAFLENKTPKEEIYYKVAKKFSLNTIIDEKVKQDLEKRLTAEAGPLRPQIVIEPASFHFGEVSRQKGKISKVFKVHNKGKASLVITNIKTSCACTLAALSVGKNKSPYFGTKGAPVDWQAELKPDEAGELGVVLDLNHKSVKAGDLIREVSIKSNDPLYPEVSLRVEAQVSAQESRNAR
ncbi:MAG: DUF1573 domain-containing protein [Pseudomonadota bacterium]